MASRFRGAVRGAVVCGVVLITTFTVLPANAEPPEIPTAQEVKEAQARAAEQQQAVKAIQTKLAAAQEQLETLQVEAEVAAEGYNGARLKLAEAKAAAAKQQRELTSATQASAAAQKDVADLARASVQGDVTLRQLGTILGSGPDEILDQAALLSKLSSGMSGKLERLRAAEEAATIADRAAQHASAIVDLATKTAAEAKRVATEAATVQASAVAGYDKERKSLLVQLADAQQISVDLARKRQEGLEAQERARREAAAKAAQEAQLKREAEQRTRDEASGEAAPTTPAPKTPATPPAQKPGAERTYSRPATAAGDYDAAGAQTAIAFAYEQVGEPYVFGAAGPDVWDCSGLTMKAWAAAGHELGHYTGDQWNHVTPIKAAQLRPGDLIFWSTNPNDPLTIFHVALYIGDGKMIHAPRPGRNVEVQNIHYWKAPTYYGRP